MMPSAADVPSRLEEILLAYHRAVEAGLTVDWRDLPRRHPHLAADLDEYFSGHEQAARLIAPLRGPSAPPSPNSDEAPTRGAQSGTEPRAPSTRFGDYEIVEELARGGMGVVYKARQLRLNREVALKMILGGAAASPEDLHRFRIEAEAAASLDHPNIVPIHEFGERNGQSFLCMKFIEGESLAQRLTRLEGSAIGLERQRWAADMLARIARAVHYAHQRGILHRDLKPGNILLQREFSSSSAPPDTCPVTPYVTDFGLAKRLEVDAQLTQSGAIVGTPSYMAPEQASGKKDLSPAVDIYGLGAILFHLLTGRRPFHAETPIGTLVLVQTQQPNWPSSLNRLVNRDLETICLKCLEKPPRNRYGSAYELAEDLERFLAGEPIRARPLRFLERGYRWVLQRPAIAALIWLALLVVAVGIVQYGWNRQLIEELRIKDDIIKRHVQELRKKSTPNQ